MVINMKYIIYCEIVLSVIASCTAYYVRKLLKRLLYLCNILLRKYRRQLCI